MPHSADAMRQIARWYDRHAREFFSQTKDLDTSGARERFLALVPPHGRVLDAGCGSGRDSLCFLEQGLAVDAFDASAEMARLAQAHTGLDVACLAFHELEAREVYHGVWALASLIHLPPKDLAESLFRLGRALRPGGVLMASFRHGQGSFERHGLCFHALDEAGLARLARGADMPVLRSTWLRPDDRPGREDRPWLYALMVRPG